MMLHEYSAPPGASSNRGPSYEWKVVMLMSLGMGLVGVDRFLIVPLMPVLASELHLDYQDLGEITGALALAWGASALFTGNLADRIGFKAVVIPATILFSMLAGVTGLVIGAGSLIAARTAMGLAEGAFVPASIIATIDASKPSRHGFNVGIQQAMPALLGLGLTPIAATELLRIMNWRWIFLLVAIPGLIVARLSAKVLRKPPARALQPHSTVPAAKLHVWHHALRYRNVLLAVLAMLCWLSCNIVIAALFPSYLVESRPRHAADGPGAVLARLRRRARFADAAAIVRPDRAQARDAARRGRRVGGAHGAGQHRTRCPGAVRADDARVRFRPQPDGPDHRTGARRGCARGLMSTASGLVVGVGEVFGGGIAPSLAGVGAQHFGIGCALDLPILALGCGLVAVALLEETAPRTVIGNRTPTDRRRRRTEIEQ